LQQLLAAGIHELDLGYRVSLDWNEGSQAIEVSSLSLHSKDLLGLSIAGVLGNATRDLFDANPQIMQAAVMALTAKELEISLDDDGLGGILYSQIGAQQGINEQAVRTMLSVAAQAMVIQSLGTTEQAQQLGAALIRFIGGGTSLSLTLTAVSPAGITAPELMQAQTDPTSLIGKVEIEAHAE
jgi:hypothetical protein